MPSCSHRRSEYPSEPVEIRQCLHARHAISTGRCHSFGAEADGYVPGEGVGAVVLKPLDQAEKDGDFIYGVIKASAINHGGRTNGFSVPNPAAQADVIAQTLRKAGLDPRSISYLEAHGTGTELGDPIEVDGLAKAFTELRVNATSKRLLLVGSHGVRWDR